MPAPRLTMTDEGVHPRTFAAADRISHAELIGAPVRWPRPSRLQALLEPSGKRMAAGLSALGLQTVGDLLEHIPSDSREARTVSALTSGEQATVAVEVRSIASRSVRRRGMRPLVEAIVFDASASMRATFFNQPWLVERYQPGTRLLLHGKADGRGGFRVSHHAPASEIAVQATETDRRQSLGRALSGRRRCHLNTDPHAGTGSQACALGCRRFPLGRRARE